jgi:hypothetical protein
VRRWPLLLAGLCALSARAAEPVAADRFERLKSLAVGEWQGETASGTTLHVNYKTISRGSALVEIWQPGTRAETMTVFHRDGDRVLATHYCAQGNQPRLALRDGGSGDFTFQYLDATHLQDGASHLHRLAFAPSADGGLQRDETYRGASGEETTRLRLRRAAAKP